MTLEQVGLAMLGLVDASQSGHAGKAVVTHALCHSGQAKPLLPSQHSSEGSERASRPSCEWETAPGALFMVILNMQQSFPNIRVINITAPSDLESASMLLTFTGRDKMLNYLCFDYEQI